jgi:hypothetical protein
VVTNQVGEIVRFLEDDIRVYAALPGEGLPLRKRSANFSMIPTGVQIGEEWSPGYRGAFSLRDIWSETMCVFFLIGGWRYALNVGANEKGFHDVWNILRSLRWA